MLSVCLPHLETVTQMMQLANLLKDVHHPVDAKINKHPGINQIVAFLNVVVSYYMYVAMQLSRHRVYSLPKWLISACLQPDNISKHWFLYKLQHKA